MALTIERRRGIFAIRALDAPISSPLTVFAMAFFTIPLKKPFTKGELRLVHRPWWWLNHIFFLWGRLITTGQKAKRYHYNNNTHQFLYLNNLQFSVHDPGDVHFDHGE
jgi:hypothetical protein